MLYILLHDVFLYAIFGNHIVALQPGIHQLNADIANIAVEQLKIAEVTSASTDLQPKIAEDIDKNPLTDAQIACLYGPSESFLAAESSAEKPKKSPKNS